MKFIEQDGSHTLKFRVRQRHAGEDALCHHLNPGALGYFGFHPYPIANCLANLLPQKGRHTTSSGADGEPARRQHQDAAIFDPRRSQQSQRC